MGSLPRPRSLLELYLADAPLEGLPERLRAAVQDIVRRQVEIGLDVVNDGEFGKPPTGRGEFYGQLAWVWYVRNRLTGFEPVGADGAQDVRTWACTGEISFVGHDAVRADIANLHDALAQQPTTDAFLSAASPTSVRTLLPNRYYTTPEEYGWAVAKAMREEYRAIADAGVVLQVDDPVLPPDRGRNSSVATPADYRRAFADRIELVNYALEGIPEEQVRYHLCWGAGFGPHTEDVELQHIVDLVLRINAGAYCVEAANPRHEHEWRVWGDVGLPDGKILVPGAVTHKTSVVEHPEVVADRIVRYADAVGRENVVASTDCGLGGRTSDEIAWEKMASLVEGARLASARLWRKRRRTRPGY